MSDLKLKHCPKCNQDKPTSAFYKDKCNPDGLTCYCRSCKRTSNEVHKRTSREIFFRERMGDWPKSQNELDQFESFYQQCKVKKRYEL